MAMAKAKDEQTQLPTHGAAVLPSVRVDSYNLEVEDDEGFVGDRANKGAFWDILDKWRKPLKKLGQDPFGDLPSEDIGKKKLAELLSDGDADAAGVVQSAVEEFAQQLALVIRRFLRSKDWRDTECLVIGGGFRGSRVGELAIARAGLILKADKVDIVLEPIRSDTNEAGLLGAAHLLPAWMLKGYEGILAVDVGGTNIRAGVVELNLENASDLSKAKVVQSELWRHGDEDVSRDNAVEQLTDMLEGLLAWAKKNKISLAPVIGIGCPGIIHEDGSIARGAQNLPGNWESSRFHLPRSITEAVPQVGDHETLVVMHNDAVVQGLSETPFVQDRKHWGVLTIGTGLGNARFTNRHSGKAKSSSKD
jgi:ROK family